MGTAGPIAVFLEMAAATYLKTLIDVDGFCPKTAKLVIIGLIVARQAPYLATAVLQAWDVMARSFRAKPADIRDSLHQLSVERRNIRIDGSQTKAYAIPWTAFIDAAVCELEDLEDLEETP